MSIRICGIPALLALCLGAVAFPAAAGEVYQWKDAKGVTHYSDAPPPKGRYEARDIRQRGIQRDGTAAAAAPAPASAAKPAPDANANCTLARTNLQRLQAGGDIGLDANGDGKPDATMDAAERARQTGLAEANIRSFCAAAPTAPKTP